MGSYLGGSVSLKKNKLPKNLKLIQTNCFACGYSLVAFLNKGMRFERIFCNQYCDYFKYYLLFQCLLMLPEFNGTALPVRFLWNIFVFMKQTNYTFRWNSLCGEHKILIKKSH